MYGIRLTNIPDVTWISVDKELLYLYSPNDYLIKSNQLYIVNWPNFLYNCDANVIGIPFKDKQVIHCASLYNPEGSFAWRGGGEVYLAIINKYPYPIKLHKGMLLSKIKFMTIQYFNLMKKHNGSDRGLRSSKINIELRYETQ